MELKSTEIAIEHYVQSHRVKTLLITLAVVVACAFAFEWLQEHDARIHAEANAAIQQAKIDTAEKSIKDRNKDLADTISNLRKTDNAVKTPSQAVAAQDTLGLHLPAPTFQYDAKMPEQVKAGDLVVPQADIVPIFHQINACQQSTASLATCSKNYGDMIVERDGWKKKSDDWEQTAKGGSKLHRTFRALGVASCGGAGAYAGAQANAKGAAIGALAGAAVCHLLLK
jgi:hypothetical protein